MNERDGFDPYTYITTAVKDGIAVVDISFYTADMSAVVLGADRERPSLLLGTPQGEVRISTTGAGPATAADVALARKISAAATRYLAACERLHADPDGLDEATA